MLGSARTGLGSIRTAQDQGSVAGGGGSGDALEQLGSWDNAMLAAFRAVNDQLYQPAFPTIDMLRGSIAAELLAVTVSGAGSAVNYSATVTGVAQLVKGTASGFAKITTAANIIFPSPVVPLAIGARIRLTDKALFTAATTVELVSFSNETTYGVAVQVQGTTGTLVINATDGTGQDNEPTSHVVPSSSTWFDVGLLWDGAQFICFFGQAVRGTFAPDLTNILTSITHAGGMASARGRIQVIDTTATQKTVDVDKLQIWTGLVP